MPDEKISKAADIIRASKYAVVFTGAGISVESGIPPFRGPGGLWTQVNPAFIEFDYFLANPKKSWEMIKKIFFDFIGNAKPNAAHTAIADLEKQGFIKAVMTQNIDGLHQKAGSRKVYEYHGATEKLFCLDCLKKFPARKSFLEKLPPKCQDCGGLLKPDFVFFSEPIPEDVHEGAFREAEKADVMLVIGTTGEIMPAALLPRTAKDHGAVIIEINTEESAYTAKLTDLFLRGKASEILTSLTRAMTA